MQENEELIMMKKLINFERKKQKCKASDLQKKIRDAKEGNKYIDIFHEIDKEKIHIPSEKTIRRYLNESTSYGANNLNFFYSVTRILGLDVSRIYSMIDCCQEMGKDITFNDYVKKVRPYAENCEEKIKNYKNSYEFKKDLALHDPSWKRRCEIKKILDDNSIKMQIQICEQYDHIIGLSNQMKKFWHICIDKVQDDAEYLKRINDMLEKKRKYIKISLDFKKLLKMHENVKAKNNLKPEELREYSPKFDLQVLQSASIYCKLTKEMQEKFFYMAIKYSFFKEPLDFENLEERIN